MSPVKRTPSNAQPIFDKIEAQIKTKDSLISLTLGLLVVLVVGLLIINYFKKSPDNLGPAQTTSNLTEQVNSSGNQVFEDVKADNLPGKYTVKSGDTLFIISQSYYNNGYEYTKLAEANNLNDPDLIEVGQVLTIPKLENQESNNNPNNNNVLGTGGATNQTIWGERITSDTYTVAAGDWLTKIAGRAYGDINQFDKIVKANNITSPDVIEVGTTLKIPK